MRFKTPRNRPPNSQVKTCAFHNAPVRLPLKNSPQVYGLNLYLTYIVYLSIDLRNCYVTYTACSGVALHTACKIGSISRTGLPSTRNLHASLLTVTDPTNTPTLTGSWLVPQAFHLGNNHSSGTQGLSFVEPGETIQIFSREVSWHSMPRVPAQYFRLFDVWAQELVTSAFERSCCLPHQNISSGIIKEYRLQLVLLLFFDNPVHINFQNPNHNFVLNHWMCLQGLWAASYSQIICDEISVEICRQEINNPSPLIYLQ